MHNGNSRWRREKVTEKMFETMMTYSFFEINIRHKIIDFYVWASGSPVNIKQKKMTKK